MKTDRLKTKNIKTYHYKNNFTYFDVLFPEYCKRVTGDPVQLIVQTLKGTLKTKH